MQRISDKRMKEFESVNWPDGWGPEILQAMKAERKYASSLAAQIKSTVDLYFEGCAADTFDDRMRELQQALEN